MTKSKRSKSSLRLKPSYSTRVHIKRRFLGTDWRFLAALAGLAGLTAAATTYFG
jgi:hypothetical protein